MNINSRILHLRKHLKISQTEFANRLGVSQPSLSDIEKGKTVNIDERNIKLICREFNVNEHWLRTGEGQIFSQTSIDLFSVLGDKIYSLTEIEKKAIIEFVKLPDEHRKIIMNFMVSI
jgi:transcriptional regulator with XRE-family HTH domain